MPVNPDRYRHDHAANRHLLPQLRRPLFYRPGARQLAYLFALNLTWWLFQGFSGDEQSRWPALLRRGLRSRPPVFYLGHNPPVRVVGTLAALLAQAGVGLGVAR